MFTYEQHPFLIFSNHSDKLRKVALGKMRLMNPLPTLRRRVFEHLVAIVVSQRAAMGSNEQQLAADLGFQTHT